MPTYGNIGPVPHWYVPHTQTRHSEARYCGVAIGLPPQGNQPPAGGYKQKAPGIAPRGLGGDDLLSHFRSTIGAVRLNFSVRNGKRWIPHAVVTLSFFFSWRPRSRGPVWLEGRYTEAALALNNL